MCIRDRSGQTSVVYDFSDPYWLVRYLEGDWEELNRHEVKQGKELATALA